MRRSSRESYKYIGYCNLSSRCKIIQIAQLIQPPAEEKLPHFAPCPAADADNRPLRDVPLLREGRQRH
jgi:hypothetical protein